MSAVPTQMPTVTPAQGDLTPSSLVMGMGVGTLTIIILSAALFVVWCISDGCGFNAKACSRCLSTLIYVSIFLALVFAPRESQYQSTLPETEIYDHSIPIRIAICTIIGFFSILATLILLKQSNKRIELTTIYHDNITFWQDE